MRNIPWYHIRVSYSGVVDYSGYYMSATANARIKHHQYTYFYQCKILIQLHYQKIYVTAMLSCYRRLFLHVNLPF